MTTKLGRKVTYHVGLSHIKSHDPSIKWSFEITGQTESIISLLPQYLCPLNLAGY